MAIRTFTLDSSDALLAHAGAWNDLWRRAEVAMPTKRAELLVDWLKRFADGRRFFAIVVADGDRMLASLPLVESRIGRALRIGELPVNSWSSAGDFLLDANCNAREICRYVVSEIRGLPWPVVRCDTIEHEAPRWAELRKALNRNRHAAATFHQFDIGLIDIGDEWDAYQNAWSKNHRKDIARRRRRASEHGAVSIEFHRDLDDDAVERKMTECFEVEDRGWKGPIGSSVLRTPGAVDFYLKQARRIARLGLLELVMLRIDGWPIAFEYGYRSAGVYFSHKVGFDEAYRQFAPGQLLMRLQLERYHENPEIRLVNCMGPLSEAVAKWCTRSRGIGRLLFSTGGPFGTALLHSYRCARPIARKLRGLSAEKSPHVLGAISDPQRSKVKSQLEAPIEIS